MNLKDILDSEITQKQLEERIVREGNLVLQVITHPGWQLVEGCLLMAKVHAERERKKSIVKQSTRENALYYCGLVDGIEEAKQAIYDVIKSSERLRESKNNAAQMEEADA